MNTDLLKNYCSKFYSEKKSSPLDICKTNIMPGENVTLALPLPEVLDLAPLYMPVKIKHGKKKGPILLIIGSIHGDGFNGMEIINRLMCLPLLKKMSGTLICTPALNIFGMLNRSRVTPDNKELDFSFPGLSNGTYSERLANLFYLNIYKQADFCIELKTGGLNYYNIPQVFVNNNDEICFELAKSFNANVISENIPKKGTLEFISAEEKKPFIVFKGGEGTRFDKEQINFGLRGIVNSMRTLGMLTPLKNSKINKTVKFFTVEENYWIKAPKSGLSLSLKQLGSHVKKGEKIGVIKEPLGKGDETPIISTEDGIITCFNMQPLVYEGEPVYSLSKFKNMQYAADNIQSIDI